MSASAKRTGIFYMLIASFCFALTGACTRWMRNDIPPVELVFFRNLIGVFFIVYSLLKSRPIQTGGRPLLLIFRGIIGTIALYTFFYGISKIGLAEAITYQQSYPAFLALTSYFFLGEKLHRIEWIAIFIGFSGICCIFLPQFNFGNMHARSHVIGLSNAIMTGMAYLSIRGLSAYYDTRTIVLSFMLSGILLPLLSMGISQFSYIDQLDFLMGKFVYPNPSLWIYIAVLGLSALVGQIYLTKAFSYEKTGVVAAVGYSNIVFSIIFGILLGDALPSTLSFIGIALIVGCGIMISAKK